MTSPFSHQDPSIMTDSPEIQRLAAASRQLLIGAEEADRAFGPRTAQGAEEVEEWAHSATWDLSEAFEVAWSESAEEDLATLDRLAAEWGEMPDEDALLQIALTWGSFLGERITAAAGGSWVYREDPLHDALHFPRQKVEFFPMHAILARFLIGSQAGIEAGYHQLVEFLTSS